MQKRFIAICLAIMLITACSSCGIKNDADKSTAAYSLTQKETYIHNSFKDRLPDFKFDNEPVERYRDGMSFIMNVTCTQKEFEKYTKKLKKEGFDQDLVEAQTYFSASTEDGFFVKVTYVEDMLTVLVKSI